jgi:hypothetical protein
LLSNEADQGAQHAQADLAQDAIAAAGRPRASFEVFGKVQDAGALIAIEGAAMLARIHDEACTAAITSHADLLLSVAARSAGKPLSFSKMACFVGKESARKVLSHSLFEPVFPRLASPLPSGFFAVYALRNLTK